MPKRPPRQPDAGLNRSAKRLTDAQRKELAQFSHLLTERMRAHSISVAKLAKHTGLRAETVRSYMRGLNRPTKGSLRRLCVILGSELARPFAGTELAGRDEDPYNVIYVSNDLVLIDAHLAMSREAANETLDVWRKHHVGEERPAPYGEEEAKSK
jgi:transcriptional regulator with XRE-family HTH domain